jgi:GGDEF domain-containing protein
MTTKSQMMERQHFSIIFWSMVAARWKCVAEKIRRGILGKPDFVSAHQSGQSAGRHCRISQRYHPTQRSRKKNRLAYFDTLTQLPNRSLFKQLVDQSLQQLRRKQTSGALLFIDLNRFKPVNDTLDARLVMLC